MARSARARHARHRRAVQTKQQERKRKKNRGATAQISDGADATAHRVAWQWQCTPTTVIQAAMGLCCVLLILFVAALAAYLQLTSSEPRIPFEQWGANEILPGLWLGNATDFMNVAQLRRRNITHILSVIVGLEPIYIKEFEHMVIRAFDYPDQDLLSVFSTAHEFIDEARAHGSVFVHWCVEDPNHASEDTETTRTLTLIPRVMMSIARFLFTMTSYVMKVKEIGHRSALRHVEAKRPLISPRTDFLMQLQLYDDIIECIDTDSPYSPAIVTAYDRWPRKARVFRFFRGTSDHVEVPPPVYPRKTLLDWLYSAVLHVHTTAFHFYLRGWYMACVFK